MKSPFAAGALAALLLMGLASCVPPAAPPPPPPPPPPIMAPPPPPPAHMVRHCRPGTHFVRGHRNAAGRWVRGHCVLNHRR